MNCMINWDKIDNKIFEEIAYQYMTANHPQLKWQKTKLTNDGNKDGEGIIDNLPLDVTVKYWYEAKYSKNITKSIPKSHLDSTLVSSILDGHVVVIAFITNAYISDDYKRRADIFARQRDNMRIIYINGEDIENWLAYNPQIETKFFKVNNAKKQLIDDNIEEVCLLDKYSSDSNEYLRLSTIELDKEYFLYIRFFSSCNQEIKLSSDNSMLFLPEYANSKINPTNLDATKGNNAYFIPIKITSIQKEYHIFLNCKGNTLHDIIANVNVLDIYKPQLIITSQINIQNDINLFIKSNDLQNLIFLILGDAGTGKTHTLNMIRDNIRNPFASITLKFSGNSEHDIITCYKIFIFCRYGNVWELNDDNMMQWDFDAVILDVLNEIKIGVSAKNTVQKLMKYCKQHSANSIEQYFLQQQIYIDDIHKISQYVAELFQTILEWCIHQRLNKRIFLFSRSTISSLRDLNDFLSINSCYIKEITQPTLNDVKCSLERNLGFIPSLISFIVHYQNSYNALYLYDLLCVLKEDINQLKELDVIDASVKISNILVDLNYAEKNKIGKRLLKEYGNYKVFYFIYRLGNGIVIDAFLDYFDADSVYADISFLYQKRIIKEVSGKLYPFHDILLEGFFKHNNDIYIDELGKFILFCIEKKYFTPNEGYFYLVSLGGKYFFKYCSIAKKFRDQLHETANYFAAEKIAKKIQEENRKNLCDYDYEDIKNLFILGNCYKYTTSYKMSNYEFEKIEKIYEISNINLPNDILLETYSEIINNNIWMLNIKKADSDLKKMAQICCCDDIISNKSKSYKYGYLNYYNRRMFCNYMLGIGSEHDYITALSKAKELELEEYEGFAHMDYAKSIYNEDITTAKKLLIQAKKIFELKGEKRRLLDASAELAFIDILENKSYKNDGLETIYYNMLEQKYIQSAIRTYIKMLVVMLLSDNYTEKELLERTNNILVKNESIESGMRHQALIYHILSAIYYKNGNIKQSGKFSQKCLKLFAELGDSYKNIHQNNMRLKEKQDIIFSYEWNKKPSKNNFILDIRVW